MSTPEQQKNDYGLVIRGICNGFREYTRKSSGQIITQLLINIPGATSSLQVEIDNAERSKFREMEPVTLKMIPTFFDGRLTGFVKA